MTDWNSKIDEALATKAKREAKEAAAAQARKDRAERQRQEAEDFARDTLSPALYRVHDLLTAPGRGREVEIRDSGPNKMTISVTDKNAPLPRSSELYMSFELGAHPQEPDHMRLTSNLGVGSHWNPLSSITGRIGNITTDQIADAIMETWAKNVSTGK